MSRGPNFIEREVFEAIISEIPRQDGEAYRDIATIYGDMSRLVVAWIATTPPDELRLLYNRLGWKGNANAVAFNAAAKKWLEMNHEGRFLGKSK